MNSPRYSVLLLVPLLLPGCNTLGPNAISNGRGTYSAAINQTSDEQVLAMIVRLRHDETFSMLSVASVTANIRAGTAVSADVGIGPGADYAGNLVPLSVGGTYEENPTISYVPVSGAKLVERMLSPIDPLQALLFGRIRSAEQQTLRLVLRRVNGLPNPLYFPGEASPGFDRFIELYAQLRDGGVLDTVSTGNGAYALFVHECAADNLEHVTELLSTIGVRTRPRVQETLAIPLRFSVGESRSDGIDFETASALEVMQAAAAGVEMPPGHASAPPPGALRPESFLSIRRSQTRPRDATVAVPHGGAWYYIDGADTRSKRGFVFLRTIINIRIDDSAGGAGVPTLTVPVSR